MDQYQNQPSQIFSDVAPTPYGTFWERFGAALIDGLVLAVPSYFINSAFGLGFVTMMPRSSASLSTIVSLVVGASFVSIIINWLYFALQESSAAQATLGKRALGLRVTGMNGERISFLNATGRHFAKMVSGLIIYIGYLMVLWDDRKQGLHDKMAKTLVVKG